MWIGSLTVASAHVGLDQPPPRYPTDGYDQNKACPCGVGPNDGTCSQATRSDPNRSASVTTYTAGETITVSAHEVIGHSGRWRIAFDPDGADQADFDANILLDEPDPSGNTGNVGQGDRWEWTVTLPDVPCTTCTLQLVQVMNGNTTDPVASPIGASTYYQCADIVLLEGTGDADTDTDTDSDTDVDTDTDTDTDSDSDTDTHSADVSSGEKGCGCAHTNPAAWGLLAASLVWLRRRR